MTDPTARFSDRVADYVRWRPGYPAAVLEILRRETGLSPAHVVADVGSGTGISTRLFLEHGNPVFAVEPNPEMRAAAEALLSERPGFRSVDGTAAATGLPGASVDFVVAAQAFHWFDPSAAAVEWGRILRPGGWRVLLWNTRNTDASAFLRGYEALLREHGTDYAAVNHDDTVGDDALRMALGAGFRRFAVPSAQRFDLAGLSGRLLSSSYAPAEGHPGHAPMMAALERLFAEHAEGGEVVFEYETEVYFGRG
jgi:SAM-dependent methyltransferase